MSENQVETQQKEVPPPEPEVGGKQTLEPMRASLQNREKLQSVIKGLKVTESRLGDVEIDTETLAILSISIDGRKFDTKNCRRL